MCKISKMLHIRKEEKKVRKFALANTFLINCQENWIRGEERVILDTRLLESAPGVL